MQRRTFIKQSVLWTAACAAGSRMPLWTFTDAAGVKASVGLRSGELYGLFRDPQSIYRPFVRWWWNGDKVEADELKRELHILKDAGIGGVEINPVFCKLAEDRIAAKTHRKPNGARQEDSAKVSASTDKAAQNAPESPEKVEKEEA